MTIVFILLNVSYNERTKYFRIISNYIAVILYGTSLALSQVTGLHIRLAVVLCEIICTLNTSVCLMEI